MNDSDTIEILNLLPLNIRRQLKDFVEHDDVIIFDIDNQKSKAVMNLLVLLDLIKDGDNTDSPDHYVYDVSNHLVEVVSNLETNDNNA